MIRRDCIHYHCEHDMGASIDCCTLRGLGNCPCSNDCNDYANKNKIYLLGLDVFRKRKEASAQPEQRSFSCGQENDTISRQAAIDEVKRLHDVAWANWKETRISANTMIDALKDLPPAQPKQRWVPVTERLPEEETDVIVCNANGDIQISRGSHSTEMKDYFIWYTTGWRFGKVIAWMPLPEPWKGDAE